MRNLLIIQAILVAAVAGYFALVEESIGGALAAIYGGGIALSNSILLSRRVVRATENLQQSVNAGVASLYFGAVQRFLLTLAAMGIGMGFLKLDPIALLIAFGAAQAAYFWAAAPRPGGA